MILYIYIYIYICLHCTGWKSGGSSKPSRESQKDRRAAWLCGALASFKRRFGPPSASGWRAPFRTTGAEERIHYGALAALAPRKRGLEIPITGTNTHASSGAHLSMRTSAAALHPVCFTSVDAVGIGQARVPGSRTLRASLKFPDYRPFEL